MSQPYKKYRIVYAVTIASLEKEVNDLLAKGWEISGSLAVNNGNSTKYQAMGLPANAPTHLEKEPTHDYN